MFICSTAYENSTQFFYEFDWFTGRFCPIRFDVTIVSIVMSNLIGYSAQQVVTHLNLTSQTGLLWPLYETRFVQVCRLHRRTEISDKIDAHTHK